MENSETTKESHDNNVSAYLSRTKHNQPHHEARMSLRRSLHKGISFKGNREQHSSISCGKPSQIKARRRGCWVDFVKRSNETKNGMKWHYFPFY